MGILKVGAGALKSVLEDQWREYFYCPSMEADVLVKKGENRKSKRSYNTKGSDNLIIQRLHHRSQRGTVHDDR